jgi:hypothetical protein
MGYVTFQSRQPEHPYLHHDLLWSLTDQEDLYGFQLGDLIAFHFDISHEFYDQLKSKNSPGIQAQEKITPIFDPQPGYEVKIEFKVIKRVQHVLRDWKSQGSGFRSSGMTVIVEAISDEAENVFMELQK